MFPLFIESSFFFFEGNIGDAGPVGDIGRSGEQVRKNYNYFFFFLTLKNVNLKDLRARGVRMKNISGL